MLLLPPFRLSTLVGVLAFGLCGGNDDIREVNALLGSLASASPSDRVFDLSIDLVDRPAQSPSEPQVIASATELLGHARRGSSRALYALASARLFSTAIPRTWFAEHAATFAAPPPLPHLTPAPICETLGVKRVFEPGRGAVTIDLASTSGSIVALSVVACLTQSRLVAVATSAARLQRSLRPSRDGAAPIETATVSDDDQAVLAWYNSTQAMAEANDGDASELHRRRRSVKSRPASESDTSSMGAEDRAVAHQVLRAPWVQRFSLSRGLGNAPNARYVPVSPSASLVEDLAEEFLDVLDDNSGAMTSLALLHLAAVRVEPGSRDALFESASTPHVEEQAITRGNVASFLRERLAKWAPPFWDVAVVALRVVESALTAFWATLSTNGAPRPSSTQNSVGESIFDGNDAAYSALALAAIRSPGPASLALSFAASRGLLPPGLAPSPDEVSDGHGDVACSRAVWWVDGLAEEVALDDGSSEAGLSPEDAAPGLWERHEDAFSGAADVEEAATVEWLREEAAMDHPEAHLELGELLMHGDAVAGVRMDRAAALRHFERAAALGLPDAHARLGTLLIMGGGHGAGGGSSDDDDAPNTTEARRHLDIAADAGSVDALVTLGYMHLDGNGGLERNVPRALEYLERAAEAGAVTAHHGLGSVYLMQGVRGGDGDFIYNRSRAKHHFEVAANYGFSPSQYELASLLLDDGGRSWRERRDGQNNSCRVALRLLVAIAEKAVTSRGAPSVVGAHKEFRVGSPAATEAAMLGFLALAALGVKSAQENAAFVLLSEQVPVTKLLDLSNARAQPLFGPASPVPAPPLPGTDDVTGSDQRHPDVENAGLLHPLTPRAAAYGLLLSAANMGSPRAMSEVGHCICHRWRDVHWCAAGSDADAATATTAWYERAVSLSSGHAAFALSMALASGSYGSGIAVPANLTASWELLGRVEELDYLADGVVFFGRAFVLWQERIGRSGGGLLAAVRGVFGLGWLCASGDVGSGNSPPPSLSEVEEGLWLLRQRVYGDACVIAVRAGAVACGVAALLLITLVIAAAALSPPPMRVLPEALVA